MEPVFGSDEWPEQERNRRRDAVHKEARYVFVHRDSQENRESACVSPPRGSAEDEEVLGFVHYRFVVEEDVAVLYVYELQVSGARRLGVGRVTGHFSRRCLSFRL
jgi:N-alpha-acetyltransferase 40